MENFGFGFVEGGRATTWSAQGLCLTAQAYGCVKECTFAIASVKNGKLTGGLQVIK